MLANKSGNLSVHQAEQNRAALHHQLHLMRRDMVVMFQKQGQVLAVRNPNRKGRIFLRELSVVGNLEAFQLSGKPVTLKSKLPKRPVGNHQKIKLVGIAVQNGNAQGRVPASQ